MQRRAFLKLAATTAVALAAGMEILLPKKELQIGELHSCIIWERHSLGESQVHYSVSVDDVRDALLRESGRITNQIWLERVHSAWMELAAARP